jgi:glycosyltransferase involved in cell wall biosynthesis
MVLETGGVVRCVLDICSGLAEAGHDVTLLTTDGLDLPESWKDGEPGLPRGVVIDPPRRAGGFFSAAGRRQLQPYLEAADVMHLHSMWTTANVQLAADARRRNLPYIYTIHGMLDDWSMAQRGLKKRLYLAAMGRRMLHGAAAVHCTAQAELEQARKWFPRGQGVVIPYVFDLSPYQPLPGSGPARARFAQLDTPRPTLLFLSRLHYKKGVELLLEATARLRADKHECLVLLAGSGEPAYEEHLKQLTRQLDIVDDVEFLGFVSGVEKISLYETADLFVLPTSQENFGFVFFEALAAATPVVTTRGPDTWPELEASGGGRIVESDPAAIANAVAELLDDPDRRAEMGRAGRAWVLENLSAERVVSQFESLYAEAIAGATRS